MDNISENNQTGADPPPLDPEIRDAIYRAVASEPLACALNMKLLELERGSSCVEMRYDPGTMSNIYNRAHGGAIFSLIDEAFETASQTGGTIAVALNVNVTYVQSPAKPMRLFARASETSRTRKTAGYDIRVTDENQQLIATCQALAYFTGKPLPF
ncbi:MAG: PaaI family thioesterase [Desulfobacterales bacterium]|nr:PaaI family thioesterase [Desulfobacterales bacterium]